MAKSTKTKKTKSTQKAKGAVKSTSKKVEKKLKTSKTSSTSKVAKKDLKKSETAKKIGDKLKSQDSLNTVAKSSIKKKKSAFSPKELEYFKQIILEKKREILEQLESLRERMLDENGQGFVNENSPYSLHMAEQGTDAFEKEKNFLWAQRETKFLSYLDAALKRIEDGSYGYCIECGNPIEKGRLEAVPHTQHCVSCKLKYSKK